MIAGCLCHQCSYSICLKRREDNQKAVEDYADQWRARSSAPFNCFYDTGDVAKVIVQKTYSKSDVVHSMFWPSLVIFGCGLVFLYLKTRRRGLTFCGRKIDADATVRGGSGGRSTGGGTTGGGNHGNAKAVDKYHAQGRLDMLRHQQQQLQLQQQQSPLLAMHAGSESFDEQVAASRRQHHHLSKMSNSMSALEKVRLKGDGGGVGVGSRSTTSRGSPTSAATTMTTTGSSLFGTQRQHIKDKCGSVDRLRDGRLPTNHEAHPAR